MTNHLKARVAYIYPTPMIGSTENHVEVGRPMLDVHLEKIPSEFAVIAMTGLIGIDMYKSYSIDTNIFFNDELVTDPLAEPEILEHSYNVSRERIYTATFGTPLDVVKADNPGIYVLRVSLYENIPEGGRKLLDTKETYLAVSTVWDR